MEPKGGESSRNEYVQRVQHHTDTRAQTHVQADRSEYKHRESDTPYTEIHTEGEGHKKQKERNSQTAKRKKGELDIKKKSEDPARMGSGGRRGDAASQWP